MPRRPVPGDAPPSAPPTTDRAMTLAASGAWAEVYDILSQADRSTLAARELEAFADAAWWLSRLDESMTLRRETYEAFAAEGDDRRAGYTAWFLAYDYLSKGEAAAVTGWLARARRHLTGEPECVEQGILAVADADVGPAHADSAEARALLERAIAIGQRCRSRELVALALQTLGRRLIADGEVSRGLELLDEAMVSVVGGELEPFFTGWIYCNVLGACLEIADVVRAGQWADAARAWCESIPVASPYHGLCRLYRVAVVSLRGEWADAEAEALRATGELATFGPYVVAEALYEIGEIRRRMGDLTGAEDAFTRAHGLGRDPQPGLALVRLAQGKTDAAAAALDVSLAADAHTPLTHARLLAARCETALAAGDLDAARAAMRELDEIGSQSPGVLRATADAARGALRLAEGDPRRAIPNLGRARIAWDELKMPYEAARARMMIGLAARAAGDAERADLEFRVAQAEFERLGAAVDAENAARLLSGVATLPGGLTAREAEVLRLLATGMSNRDIGGALFISERTVARHVSNIFSKLDVSSRTAATAFAFEHRLV